MVADMSLLVELLSERREEQPQMNGAGGGNSEILTTRDLLGSLSQPSSSNKELDLDLLSGKVYTERCNSPNSPLVPSSSTATSISSLDKKDMRQTKTRTSPDSEIQGLSHIYNSTPPLNLFLEETCSLELKLESSSCSYQSVCTLDKVKFALQRAEKDTMKKRSSSSPPTPITSSSISSTGMFAAGCPGCLFYVIIDKANPRCPRCNAIVTSPLVLKKPRIDLNASFLSSF
ncbi:hypothetical protein CFOL_v3_09651 [Cephalotus follicularis]|uniref:GIR1-like zinc ribbon domain-containing protein n=1 Tax=Cephalotus follicularis TaxID=3775 RepID=A0A1Q3BDQ2_CEPFO|nr:hypothetical protein CFOL_v3_09651 [Cephalotus follicularis]